MGVIARTRFQDHVLSGQGSLMAQCLAAGLPVASSCAGRGACAKCAVRLLEGLDALKAPDAREALVLAREGFAEDVRLACQARVQRHWASVVLRAGYW
jgi:ferredoxin